MKKNMKTSLLSVALLSVLCISYGCCSVMGGDPLQPVWDSIEKLPAKIIDDMQKILHNQMENLNRTLDAKMQKTKSDLQSILAATSKPITVDDDDGENLIKRVSSILIMGFGNFYNTLMKPRAERSFNTAENSIVESVQETERKVTRHVNKVLRKPDFLFDLNNTLEDHVVGIMNGQSSQLKTIEELNKRVKKIWMDSMHGRKDICQEEDDRVKTFIDEKLPSQQRLYDFEREWDATYHNIAVDIPSLFHHRDCSDILHFNPDSPSGVYTIFPSKSEKRSVDVWCDMDTVRGADSTAGWTVMLRRRNTTAGFLNFNRTWEEYANGFGTPGTEGEWWLGLNWVHELTYYQPYQVMFLLHDIEKGDFTAYYSTFRVEDEPHQFRLMVEGLNSTIHDAFSGFHKGQAFSTPERDNDQCSCNCALNNQGGWWYNICHRTVLTAPFPTSNDREQKTIRWLNGIWLVLDDVTMMIKPSGFD